MPEITGRKVSFGLAKETTRGTAEAAAAYWLNHQSLGFHNHAEKVLNTSALGVLNTNNDSDVMHEWGEGDFEMKFGAQSGGLLLLAGMGSVTSAARAAPNAAVYDHTYTLSQSNSPQSVTLFRSDANSTQAFALGMLQEMEFTMELGDWLRTSGTFLSKAGATSSATVARISETEFKPRHANVYFANDISGLDAAAAIATVQSFRLTIDRGVERDHSFGASDPYDISVRTIEISGELVLRYSDTTYRDQFLTDAKKAMRISLTDTQTTIGTSANPQLRFDMPKVSLDNWELSQDLDDKVTQTLGFQALYDTTTASAITARLTNTVTSY